MGYFQCSSSWGFPEVKKLRYESYRNYSKFLFEFDRNNSKARIESSKIRDPRIRCFSWSFDVDEKICCEVDRLASIGRIGEINSEKKSYSTGSYWSSEVSFECMEHRCSSSSEYPFSVLEMEDGLLALSELLADRICANLDSADSIHLEFSSDHRNIIAADIVKDDVRMEIGYGENMSRKSFSNNALAKKITGILIKLDTTGPKNIVTGNEEVLSGRIIVNFGTDSFRVDVVGDATGDWIKFVDEIVSDIDDS